MVCRRTGDVWSVVWTHRLDETPSARVWRVAISARADRVAAVAAAARGPESPETSRRLRWSFSPCTPSCTTDALGSLLQGFPADIHFSRGIGAFAGWENSWRIAQRIPTLTRPARTSTCLSTFMISRVEPPSFPRGFTAGFPPGRPRNRAMVSAPWNLRSSRRTLPSDVGLRSNDRLGGCGLSMCGPI